MSNNSKSYNILLCVTGSVASIYTPELSEALCELGNVKVVTTDTSLHFFNEEAIPNKVLAVHASEEDFKSWLQRSDPVLHIELRRWADLCVIAPLSANTLAKISSGISDNLLTCVIRAWDYKKPLLLAPAMNTMMWENVLTDKQLKFMEELGATIIPPQVKTLMCGDTGNGALADEEVIIEACKNALKKLNGTI